MPAMDAMELAARLAQEAYREITCDADSKARADAIASWLPTLTSVRSTEDGFGALCVNCPGKAYLVFRGTELESVRDLLSDGEIAPLAFINSYNSALVHGGFRRAQLGLRDWVDRLGPFGAIQVTAIGHSAGGDLAELFAVYLKSVTDVYTFGAAKLGYGRSFTDCYTQRDLRTSRIVHALDIVPSLLTDPYEHPTPAVTITTDGAFCEPPARFQQALADLDGEALELHHVAGYVSACANNAARRRQLDLTPRMPS